MCGTFKQQLTADTLWQHHSKADILMQMSFTDRPSMPACIVLEHSTLPDAAFKQAASFEISSKQVQQANQGRLNEVCIVMEVDRLQPILRFLRLRLLGHQPTKVLPRTTQSGETGRVCTPFPDLCKQLLYMPS